MIEEQLEGNARQERELVDGAFYRVRVDGGWTVGRFESRAGYGGDLIVFQAAHNARCPITHLAMGGVLEIGERIAMPGEKAFVLAYATESTPGILSTETDYEPGFFSGAQVPAAPADDDKPWLAYRKLPR